MEKLDRFVAMLTAESALQNLVAKPSLEVVWQRHIADSAQLLEYFPRETGRWLDLGTGAGLPGVIIAIMRPEWPVMLVESRRRRIEWLLRVTGELELPYCQVIGKRLEQVETVPVSVISARAFAPLATILDLSARFSTSETVWLLPKGRSAAQELNALDTKQKQLFHVKQSVTDRESGIIVGKLS
ncbi:16S rRNA (guanine(527)-N(7))-methyltransferase RsmG [Allopontixanthobacter sp.]|uniref:16S rRNA (guanine(527)-N(7))-methyltransferase RsmG n=1 Tax=Allopontixanthobacter sp. TaxID=2906452 RepID=UPI002ABC3753|nr:16S rRNA (guanine(527)-N(7))-methyltransferase RsmG [Allopontixanthobacter sp.]MDZ4308475.1 16S rRNA (guanine(527)-N(7))-methyltransferase RsmG [Allopontixanthobacter sp.]